ncbi:sensor histidine kinase [Cognatishimia activa]|uniref:sensor histidine kinase n=1 Tax=Cognatishimia activa TaxID=1715691 RepID=UPI002232B3CB|nr:ATP-binding protein [Cognatishimia activa]UZD89563.1 ATP-binding protein [Cognatishimia activa]
MRRPWLATLFLAGVLSLTAAVWVYSAVQSIDELERRGEVDLALASDRLVGNLTGFRQLAVTLAADPRIVESDTSNSELIDILRRATDISGALDFVLLDRGGHHIASAADRPVEPWLKGPFIDRALDGALGRHLTVSEEFGRRVFVYAAPVFSNDGPVSRVLVVILDLEAIEADFRGSNPAVLMTDHTGIVYFSNRSELVLRDRFAKATDPSDDTAFVDFTDYQLFGFDLWSVSAGRYVPSSALHIEQELPVIGMRSEALIDLRPALATAWLQSVVAGTICLLMGSAIFFVSNQRRILAEANQKLESRVAKRTYELSEVNTALRAEVHERREAEKALKRAQADLVQAGKLSALGKMSAGISHELNQPLMAIQSFADNSVTFLERENQAAASRNMSKVSDLARRMARIIKNFRAFARQEHETLNRVELVQIVKSAIELADNHLERHAVSLDMSLPHDPIWVQGGEVRLQQVVLNLVTNAVDAMATSDERHLQVSIEVGSAVVLSIRDTGPGIEEPEKVFEPFYSTKEIGEAEGVGLGLSISYGLVQSFGGNIRGVNSPEGGAVFTVELQPWKNEAAA